jgi:NADH-quinone oxidoreductase subunit K
MITQFHYTLLSIILFCIGLIGIFIRKQNLISLLMAVELMLLGVNINMVAVGMHNNGLENQIFCLFIVAIAAAETAIGLALIILIFKHNKSLHVSAINTLNG